MNKIAKVILPIAVEREFDYSIPSGIKISRGARVLVDFGGRKKIGIAAAFADKSKIVNLKPIQAVLDTTPFLNSEHIKFARVLTKMYPYSLGEFLFMFLPAYLKKLRKSDLTELKNKEILLKKTGVKSGREKSHQHFFIKGSSFPERYRFWKETAARELKQGSVLICFPQIAYLEEARKIIEKDFPDIVRVIHSKEKEQELFNNWADSREKSLILGTRVSIFYYPADLRLIIVEEENSPYYFQEEKPYYHLLDIAFLLSKMKKADLILSGDYPSFFTYKLIKEKKAGLQEDKEPLKDIQVVDIGYYRKAKLISPLMIELLGKNIEEKKKSVILWNRKGFASVISCSSCGYIFRCGHCLSFLRSSLKDERGICPYCGKQEVLPKICNQCAKGYLKVYGLGIERIGVILKSIFPEAKINNWEDRSPDTDIILSTSKILSSLYTGENFDTGFVLDIDSFLSRLDYEATLDAFLYLKKLSSFFNKLYVFTRNSSHYLFSGVKCWWSDFYEKELSLRKELNLPPFGVIAKVILRGKNENRVLKKIEELYARLKNKGLEVYGPFEEYPFKLRDKYRYSLTVKSNNNSLLRRVIKENILGLRSSHIKLAVVIR